MGGRELDREIDNIEEERGPWSEERRNELKKEKKMLEKQHDNAKFTFRRSFSMELAIFRSIFNI